MLLPKLYVYASGEIGDNFWGKVKIHAVRFCASGTQLRDPALSGKKVTRKTLAIFKSNLRFTSEGVNRLYPVLIDDAQHHTNPRGTQCKKQITLIRRVVHKSVSAACGSERRFPSNKSSWTSRNLHLSWRLLPVSFKATVFQNGSGQAIISSPVRLS